MLTIGKDDDDDEEMKQQPKKFKKVVKSLSSIFVYIKSYIDHGCGY